MFARKSLAEVYRESELFLELRSPAQFKGICGNCEFNRICGGSRSRAYAITGDYLATDPWCAYGHNDRSPMGSPWRLLLSAVTFSPSGAAPLPFGHVSSGIQPHANLPASAGDHRALMVYWSIWMGSECYS